MNKLPADWLAYSNWSVTDQLKFVRDILRRDKAKSFGKLDTWVTTSPRDLLYLN